MAEWQSIRPVKTLMWCRHGYLSGAKCKYIAYDPVVSNANPSSHASIKSRMVYLSCAILPKLCWKSRGVWSNNDSVFRNSQYHCECGLLTMANQQRFMLVRHRAVTKVSLCSNLRHAAKLYRMHTTYVEQSLDSHLHFFNVRQNIHRIIGNFIFPLFQQEFGCEYLQLGKGQISFLGGGIGQLAHCII